jgi:hypothetical protein
MWSGTLARKVSPQAALARLHDARLKLPKLDPGQSLTLRDKLFEMAGISQARQARLLALAVRKIEESLSAMSPQRLVYGVGLGKSEIREFLDVDHAERRKAAGEVIELLGAKPSKTSINLGGSGPMQVNISFAPLRQSAKVIEAEVIPSK